MVVLPGHRPEPAHLPEQPLQHLEAAAQILWQELAGLLAEIDEDGARFEDADRRPAARRFVVDHGGHVVFWADTWENRLSLLPPLHIYAVELGRQAPPPREQGGPLTRAGRRKIQV